MSKSKYTLNEQISVMKAKASGSDILVRPHNGPDWISIDRPEFNWGVSDYKVKLDYKDLFKKIEDTIDYNELYQQVHYYERGKNLENIIDYCIGILTTLKENISNNVETSLNTNLANFLSITEDEFKTTSAYKTISTSLYNEYLERATNEYTASTSIQSSYSSVDAYYAATYADKIESTIKSMITELNNILAKSTGINSLKSIITNTISNTIDSEILIQKGKSEEDLLDNNVYTSENTVKENVNKYLEKVCEEYNENGVLSTDYITAGDENIHITLKQNPDYETPAIQITYAVYQKQVGEDEVPDIDWDFVKDKAVTVSNITSDSLDTISTRIDNLQTAINNISDATSQQIKTYVESELPAIRTSISNLSKTVSDNYASYQNYISTSRDNLITTGPIKYAGPNVTRNVISFIAGSNSYGDGIVIGADGTTIIGSGESPTTYKNNSGVGANTEQMVVTADQNVNIITNLDSGYNNRKTFTFDNTGGFTADGAIYSGGNVSANGSLSGSSISTSGNITANGSVTASNFIGALNGISFSIV